MRLPQSIRFPGGTRCRSPGVSPAAFLAHPPDLQPWPLMDMDFATSCPLVRPSLPRIRLLFVGSRFRSTLPSDGPSRFRPCASLVLHLHQVAQGTFTPKLPDMSDTQAGREATARDARLGLDGASTTLSFASSGMNGDCDYVTLWRLGRPRGKEQGRGSSPVAQPMIVAPPLWRPSAPLAIAVSRSRRSGGIHPRHWRSSRARCPALTCCCRRRRILSGDRRGETDDRL